METVSNDDFWNSFDWMFQVNFQVLIEIAFRVKQFCKTEAVVERIFYRMQNLFDCHRKSIKACLMKAILVIRMN